MCRPRRMTAQVNISGITVTHTSGSSDSVNSLNMASGTTLSLSSGTLSIAAASTLSGNLVIAGATLGGAGTLTVQRVVELDRGDDVRQRHHDRAGGPGPGRDGDQHQLPGVPLGPHPRELRRGHPGHLRHQPGAVPRQRRPRWPTRPARPSPSPTTCRSGPTAAARSGGVSATRGPLPRRAAAAPVRWAAPTATAAPWRSTRALRAPWRRSRVRSSSAAAAPSPAQWRPPAAAR